MKKYRNLQKLLFSSILALGCAYLNAETFRVSKLHLIDISQNSETEASAKPGINDSVAIKLPEDKTFIEGIEIKMEIPEAVATWMDSVACSVYQKINPTPSPNQIDYSGSRIFVNTVPNRLSWIIQIPIKKENSIKTNKYTTKIDSIVDVSDGYIFVRFQPVMKGVPEETLNAKIPLTIKPILSNKGRLSLTVNSPEADTNYTVFIDEKPVELSSLKNILLDTGIHNLSVISEAYRNEARTIRIEQAKTTALNIDLRSVEPTIVINAPEGTEVLLDDEKCTTFGSEIKVSEGEHKIKFKIGDYESIRTISVNKGKTYTANFSVELQISEE